MIALPQVLTLPQARAAAQALEQAASAIPAGGTLVVDASPLQTFDTSALAALLQGLRAARARGVVLSLQGAIEGHGIAIGHLPLVLDDLRSGRLVAPFRTVAQAERAWYLSYPRAARFGGGLSAFRLWILERAGESRDDMQAWLGEKRPEKAGAPREKPASRASDPAS